MSFQISQSSHVSGFRNGIMSNMGKGEHIPVMLESSVEKLITDPGGQYLDATFGRGGHSKAILDCLNPSARLWVLDRDPEAVMVARNLADKDARVKVLQGSFSQLSDLLPIPVGHPFLDGVIFDFGVSSPQLDCSERGFSFQQDGPLDMRMDNEHGLSAMDWLARASEDELIYVFETYGEEVHAREIAKKILEVRIKDPIQTTKDLVSVVLSALPGWNQKRHPATKIFQAIRMHVNDELKEIIKGLPIVIERMKPGSRMITLTYHSLEHTLVSRVLKQKLSAGNIAVELTPNLPQLRRIGRAYRATQCELQQNPRARSALLRVWEVGCV
ncbi:MAG: 16S rRNA (cytosine(1402)-N(4))-methyltransferase RsmH [Pseudomonadota bacterium]|nr:16S rRNA (cytosine(1402)-N(4))-methyltransferase RsmH [Pseudomonadota bacterium]